jgi:hypothetical protein
MNQIPSVGSTQPGPVPAQPLETPASVSQESTPGPAAS